MLHDVDLIHIVRGGMLDCVHRGRLVITDTQGDILFAAGDADEAVYMRSIAKPFQAATVIETGAAERFGLTDQEIAIMAGSHSGTSPQAELVAGILAKIGAQVNDLHCGAQPPLDHAAARDLIARGERGTALNHNCSGKHSGMLAACIAQGWPLDSYTHFDHPLQQWNLRTLAAAAKLNPAQIGVALDGCSVPTFALPLRNIAAAFAQLGAAPADTPLGRVARAMAAYPTIYSGERRQDAAITRATNGRLIAKDGAEGAFGIAVSDQGVGVALKISDGASRAQMPALITVLHRLGYLSDDEAQTLDAQYPRAVTIHTGEIAGEMQVMV
jgi:L-asparaginase II